MKCPMCGGKGHFENRHASYIENSSYASCPKCRGSGKQGQFGSTCSQCFGTRMVRQGQGLRAASFSGAGSTIECSRCKGRGNI